MMRHIRIIIIFSLLSACSTWDNSAANRNARCHELKTRMIYNGSPYDQTQLNGPTTTNQPLLESRASAELDSVAREYRQEGCA